MLAAGVPGAAGARVHMERIVRRVDLRCVAYTGNNMRKVNAEEDEDHVQVSALAHLYIFLM